MNSFVNPSPIGLLNSALRTLLSAVAVLAVTCLLPTAGFGQTVDEVIAKNIQAHGGMGVTTDAGLAKSYAHIRTMRLVDGPDEVHNRAIARLELRKYTNARV